MYKTDIHKIYNPILGQTNYQLYNKAVLDATFQEVNT